MTQPPRDPTSGRFIASPLPASPARYVFEEHIRDRIPPRRDNFSALRSSILVVAIFLSVVATVVFAVVS